MSGWGWFILIVILLIPASYFGYVAYRRFKAKNEGIPPPPWNLFKSHDRGGSQIYPAPTGPLGWVKDKYYNLRNSRSKGGAYEQDGARGGVGGGRGHHRPLDPDEAWDARVEERDSGYAPDGDGYGGYYEEQELGLQPPPTSAGGQRDEYAGSGYGGGGEVQRGRSLSRDLREEQTGYLGATDRQRENPFGDHAEANSLRGVSPRPHQDGGKGHAREVSDGGSLKADDSPNERRSMFREENL